jgi:hypothetical protein
MRKILLALMLVISLATMAQAAGWGGSDQGPPARLTALQTWAAPPAGTMYSLGGYAPADPSVNNTGNPNLIDKSELASPVAGCGCNGGCGGLWDGYQARPCYHRHHWGQGCGCLGKKFGGGCNTCNTGCNTGCDTCNTGCNTCNTGCDTGCGCNGAWGAGGYGYGGAAYFAPGCGCGCAPPCRPKHCCKLRHCFKRSHGCGCSDQVATTDCGTSCGCGASGDSSQPSLDGNPPTPAPEQIRPAPAPEPSPSASRPGLWRTMAASSGIFGK